MENASPVINPKRGKHEFIFLLFKVAGILTISFLIWIYVSGLLAKAILAISFCYLIFRLEEVSKILERLKKVNFLGCIKVVFAIAVLGLAFNKLSVYLSTDRNWSFVGYEYKWSENYVEKKGFKSEEACVEFGDLWLEKQESDEALYTCNVGCRPDKSAPGIDICKKVCEYGKQGFLRCRY